MLQVVLNGFLTTIFIQLVLFITVYTNYNYTYFYRIIDWYYLMQMYRLSVGSKIPILVHI